MQHFSRTKFTNGKWTVSYIVVSTQFEHSKHFLLTSLIHPFPQMHFSNTHTLVDPLGVNSGFSILFKDTLKCRLVEQETEPPTFQLVDNLLYVSHSHATI